MHQLTVSRKHQKITPTYELLSSGGSHSPQYLLGTRTARIKSDTGKETSQLPYYTICWAAGWGRTWCGFGFHKGRKKTLIEEERHDPLNMFN